MGGVISVTPLPRFAPGERIHVTIGREFGWAQRRSGHIG
jgi:hypothetical protein